MKKLLLGILVFCLALSSLPYYGQTVFAFKNDELVMSGIAYIGNEPMESTCQISYFTITQNEVSLQ